MVVERWPSVEDDFWWKTPFGERWDLAKDKLQWKKNFIGRRPSVEDDFWWKTTIRGRQPSFEDSLHLKTTFSGRHPLVDHCMLPTPLCGISLCLFFSFSFYAFHYLMWICQSWEDLLKNLTLSVCKFGSLGVCDSVILRDLEGLTHLEIWNCHRLILLNIWQQDQTTSLNNTHEADRGSKYQYW